MNDGHCLKDGKGPSQPAMPEGQLGPPEHRLLPLVRQAVQSLLTAVRHPGQAALVFAGAVGITTGYVLALFFSLRAFAV